MIKILIKIFCLFQCIGALFAQDITVPIDVQAELFIKVCSFDRALKSQTRKEIVIGVLYQKHYVRSLNTKERFIASVNGMSQAEINGTPVRCVGIDAESMGWPEKAKAEKLDLLYVCPLRAFNIENIVQYSRNDEVCTLTGVPEFVYHGITIGLDIIGERPQILINIISSKLERRNFSSRLLNLAKIIE